MKKGKEPKEKNPWDVHAISNGIERDIEKIYAAVGRSLTNWNKVELELTRIFCAFAVYDGHYQIVARAFGAVRTFEGRQKMLQRISDAYFSCCEVTPEMQKIQSDFKYLLNTKCKGGSERRNDIAHGNIIEYKAYKDSEPNYWFGPCSIDSTKTNFHGIPDFAYGSPELNAYASFFEDLSKEVNQMFQIILKQRPPFG